MYLDYLQGPYINNVVLRVFFPFIYCWGAGKQRAVRPDDKKEPQLSVHTSG